MKDRGWRFSTLTGACSFDWVKLLLPFLFFFFQAEDGIRDFHVTGVQTCALPILLVTPGEFARAFVHVPVPRVGEQQSLGDVEARSEERRVGKECRTRGWGLRYRRKLIEFRAVSGDSE